MVRGWVGKETFLEVLDRMYGGGWCRICRIFLGRMDFVASSSSNSAADFKISSATIRFHFLFSLRSRPAHVTVVLAVPIFTLVSNIHCPPQKTESNNHTTHIMSRNTISH